MSESGGGEVGEELALQLFECDGLFEPLDQRRRKLEIFGAGLAADRDDRDARIRLRGVDRPDDFPAVHHGKDHVEKYDVRGMSFGTVDCLCAIGGEADLEAALAQSDGVEPSKIMVVFDDQNAPFHDGFSCRNRARRTGEKRVRNIHLLRRGRAGES